MTIRQFAKENGIEIVGRLKKSLVKMKCLITVPANT